MGIVGRFAGPIQSVPNVYRGKLECESHPLESGGVRQIQAVSPWQAVAGRHKLTAIVDDINRFPEQSETNNIFELDVQVFDSIES